MDLLPENQLDPGARLGATVVRVRGTLSWYGGGVGDLENTITVGACVAEVDPATNPAAGAPALDPLGDANSIDWFYWNRLYSTDATVTGTTGTTHLTTFYIDMKAARRIPAPQMTALFYLHLNERTLDSSIIEFTTSTLIKLS